MESLVQSINATFEAFCKDATLQVEKNNKAAGTRARKASLELEKLMKAFRKASLECAKK
ncbi:MAG: histone H1 [Muribaculaceae bacterium]|nr:histone H1 [Muribaculaceae bacterium]